MKKNNKSKNPNWYKKDDTRSIISPLKNAILRLGYISCLNKRIPLKNIHNPNDTEAQKQAKHTYNLYCILSEANEILDHISKDKDKGIGIKKRLKEYTNHVKKGHYDNDITI
jgi:hypothetical protein